MQEKERRRVSVAVFLCAADSQPQRLLFPQPAARVAASGKSLSSAIGKKRSCDN
jgi:hypothetical protein